MDTDGHLYVLEANPRASRTVPLVSKVCNVQMAGLAVQNFVSAATGMAVLAAVNLIGLGAVMLASPAMDALLDRAGYALFDPSLVLPGVRSIVSVAMNYYTTDEYPDDPAVGKVSRYAWGDDYHDVMRARLAEVDRQLQALAPCETKICVDTAPLLERPLAT